MKVEFTNLFKASEFGDKNFKNKVIKGFSNLISKNQFIGGKQVEIFEKNQAKLLLFDDNL